jgi:hypothetical protein
VKDANALLVAEGPEGFARTWARLVNDARSSARTRITESPAAAPAAPRGMELAAKEEKQAPPALTNTDGVYALAFGPRTYRVRGLNSFGVDRLRVNLRVEEAGRFHVDTFDLYSARARGSFTEMTSKALHLGDGAAASIGGELASVIDALEKERLALRNQGEAKTDPTAMSPAEEAEAMELLRGDILAALRRDFLSVGCIGEETAMLIGYFALVSRKLREPVSILFCARSGAGKSTLQDRLGDFCPPEDLVKYTRISGQVLFYKEEDALVHKLLVVEEEDGASHAAYALRSLLSSGYLTCSVTRTDPQTGRQLADDRRVNGPTSVFTTTAHPEAFDYETRNRYLLVTIDESREQTKRILELQRWNETIDGLIAREKRKAIFRRHHNAQRLIKALEVTIPVDLAYPSGFLILRREQKKYLSLIKAIALLHQHQRARKSVTVDGQALEYIEATQADVEAARQLASVILQRNLDELSPPSRSLYAAMRELVREKRKLLAEAKPEEPARDPAQPRRYVLRAAEPGRDERLLVDRREVQRATGLSLWHIKTYMAQLVEYEYVALVAGKKGKRCLYELLAEDEEDEAARGIGF